MLGEQAKTPVLTIIDSFEQRWGKPVFEQTLADYQAQFDSAEPKTTSSPTEHEASPETYDVETPPSANSNGLRGFRALGEFFQQDGWFPQLMEGKHIYRVGFTSKNGQMECYAQAHVNLEQLLFYVVAPVKVDDAARLAVAEFITRANYNLRIGNFELDFADGEVRYRSSLDFEATELTPILIKNTIYPAVQTAEINTTIMTNIRRGMANLQKGWGGQESAAFFAEMGST